LTSTHGDGLHLSIAPEQLREMAHDSMVARCLLASLRAARTPPGPMRLMGILNVTPDSFSDGGLHLDPERAVERGLELAREGAEILDVGGESTRPGAAPVSTEEELRRVLPVIEGLVARTSARISIDTSKAAVARAALERGAHMVNDITAGRGDPEMLGLVAEQRCELVLMHMQGSPADMQRRPSYRDPLAEIARFLRERTAASLRAGIELRRIVLDPGIGFGKLLQHNLELLRRLRELRSLGRPLCLGVSRKSFIAQATGAFRAGAPSPAGESPSDRSSGTAVALSFCVRGGAELLRVHEVARAIEATAVTLAVQRRGLLPAIDSARDALLSSPSA
jgi:dihydropteroate synthase